MFLRVDYRLPSGAGAANALSLPLGPGGFAVFHGSTAQVLLYEKDPLREGYLRIAGEPMEREDGWRILDVLMATQSPVAIVLRDLPSRGVYVVSLGERRRLTCVGGDGSYPWVVSPDGARLFLGSLKGATLVDTCKDEILYHVDHCPIAALGVSYFGERGAAYVVPEKGEYRLYWRVGGGLDDDRITRSEPLRPPLGEDDEAWVPTLVRVHFDYTRSLRFYVMCMYLPETQDAPPRTCILTLGLTSGAPGRKKLEILRGEVMEGIVCDVQPMPNRGHLAIDHASRAGYSLYPGDEPISRLPPATRERRAAFLTGPRDITEFYF